MSHPIRQSCLEFSATENPLTHGPVQCTQLTENRYLIGFEAMASPCELHLESTALTSDEIFRIVHQAIVETWRFEAKFSRYCVNNIIHQINHADGKPVKVDEETAKLLDYASRCYTLSDGMFDITSGPLRRIWKFNGNEGSPQQKQITQVLASIGWDKCHWEAPFFSLPKDGEIDFGGIGKEFAVDRIGQLIQETAAPESISVLINFGGDILCSGPRLDGTPWSIGLEKIERKSGQNNQRVFQLSQGAIATSGDTHRYLTINGQRYSHILNPKTGWPIANAPQTVTVLAPTCTLAGIIATFAMLQGADAEQFLAGQAFPHWVQRLKV